MRLTLQTHFDGEWHHVAKPELEDDKANFQGTSIVDYDLDYFVTVASAEFAAGKTVHDHRALSVGDPVELGTLIRHLPGSTTGRSAER
ncbi:hypothetical protein C8J34_110101 [Rhizobium sp. PP-F2F-G36]|nr:hypothetical protein C8J34_110101 [Rhizobium sp. PP-F2F-G36]